MSPGIGSAAALVADVDLGADADQVTRRDANGPALLDGTGRRVDGHHAVLAVDGGVDGSAIGGEDRLSRQPVLGTVRGDRHEGRVGQGAVGVHREPAVPVGLGHPERPAVGGVGRPLLADVVAADLQVRRRGVADQLLNLPVLQVDDGQRDRAVGDQGRQVGAVRADRRGHDLAAVDDQPVADRVDVLVAGDDLAPVGDLADLLRAELPRRRGANAGGREGEGDRRDARLHDAAPATGSTRAALPDLPSAAGYLH